MKNPFKRSRSQSEESGFGTSVKRQRLDHTQFSYDTRSRSKGGDKLNEQVKYGPSFGLSKQQLNTLKQHFGSSISDRLTQYKTNRQAYVKAALDMNRGLTHQEHAVNLGKDPGPTSINHIIASGTGQHQLNKETLNFGNAGQVFNVGKETNNTSNKLRGIAHQAAAIGRMRGLGRAILKEEHHTHGYGQQIGNQDLDSVEQNLQKRNMMAKDVLASVQGGNYNSYRRFLKNTFDSVGNLRLGHATGNTRVSTGYDMPLTKGNSPTARGKNLLSTLKTFGLQDMQIEAKVGRNRTGLFTSNVHGQNLSSSQLVESGKT
jgi:hypothetical protein